MARSSLVLVSCALLLACSGDDREAGAKAKPRPELVAPTQPAPLPGVHASTDPEWVQFTATFLDEYFAAHPAFAVLAGKHEHDGKLPDWSVEGISAEVVRLKTARAAAAAFSDDTLGQAQRLERDLLVSRLDRDLFWLETAKWPTKNPAFYFDWLLDGLDPAVYVTREYAPLAQRMASYIAYAKAIPIAAGQIKANLKGPLPATYLKFGIAGFGGLARYYENDVPQVFGTIEDAALSEQFKDANAGAIAAMKDLAAHLESQQGRATQDFALGADLFTQMVAQTEGLDVSLDALEAAGRADLKRNQEALAIACGKLVPGAPIADCIAKVADEKPEGGAVAGAREQLKSLRVFMDKADIVTIPGSELALVEESPPYNRQNSAYIDIPGPYETGLPSTYFIAPPDETWSKAEQLAYIPGEKDLLFTSVHEVWPGHFLQYLYANRSKSEVGRVFVGYAYSEGWAHYTEEMMCEVGLCAEDPAVKVGQLLNALLRNARFLSAIGLHARGMTVSESETIFREEAHQDAGNARQQAARGTYDPAYLNYTLGKLMILKLRGDWTAHRGGRQAYKAFHDEFLSYGGPPIPLVRRGMLGADAGPSL
ncbi:MAG: DUF885 domain-containing protein [Nannocystaceae bacterium]|nr:DUF885 domain-containing protein [Nannocystaceae bacterium]